MTQKQEEKEFLEVLEHLKKALTTTDKRRPMANALGAFLASIKYNTPDFFTEIFIRTMMYEQILIKRDEGKKNE